MLKAFSHKNLAKPAVQNQQILGEIAPTKTVMIAHGNAQVKSDRPHAQTPAPQVSNSPQSAH